MDLVGYIRVSRVAGREGGSFISPEHQCERIEAYAAVQGHVIVEWVSDLDQSGGRVDRPGFQEALGRCEAGGASGIAVARIDRFARSLVGALESIERLRAVGAILVSAGENIDASTATGRMLLNLLLALGEWERERISESWLVAREKAIGRGVHVAGQTPVGYLTDGGGRLVVDPATAPVVRQAFQLRADGAAMVEVARVLDSLDGRRWTNPSVRYLLSNRTYLGELHHGHLHNPNAHEALVSLSIFEAANARKPVAAVRSDSTGRGSLLTGLVRCAGCRRSLAPAHNSERGRRVAVYRCKGLHAAGKCPACASIRQEFADAYVAGFMIGKDFDQVTSTVSTDELAALEAAVATAETELTAYVTAISATSPGFKPGYDTRVAALNTATTEHADASRRAQRGEFDWRTLSMPERRQLLRTRIQAVFVKKGSGNVQDRCHIVWQSDPLIDLPRRGVPTPIRPFEW